MVCIRVVTKLELVRKKTLLEINYEKNVVLDLLKEVDGEFMAWLIKADINDNMHLNREWILQTIDLFFLRHLNSNIYCIVSKNNLQSCSWKPIKDPNPIQELWPISTV